MYLQNCSNVISVQFSGLSASGLDIYDAELITLLREQYGEQIKLTETLPKAYNPGGVS